MWNFCNLLVISSLTKCYNYNNVHLPVFYCQFNLKSKTMSMKSNNLQNGLQTSGDLPGQAWASRVGDIRPPSCNCSQSPIWCHLQLVLLVTGQSTFSMEQLAAIICFFRWAANFWHLKALSNIDSLSSLKLLKASEIANCCVWQLQCVQNRSTMLLFKALTTDTDSILVQSLFHSAH